MTDDELALLGHLIGDGCTLPRHVIQYTTRKAAIAFPQSRQPGLRRRDPGRGSTASAPGIRSTCPLAAAGRGRRNPIALMARRPGLLRASVVREAGARGRLPAAGQGDRPLPPAPLGHRRLRVSEPRQARSANRPLRHERPWARDRRPLPPPAPWHQRNLLAGASFEGSPALPRKAHGRTDVKRFLEIVGCLGEHRTATGSLILEAVGASSPNPNRDVIPAAAWRECVVPAMAAPGISTRQLRAGLGTRTAGRRCTVEPVPRASGASRGRRPVRGSRPAGHERRVLGSGGLRSSRTATRRSST